MGECFMELKLELIKGAVAELVTNRIVNEEIDATRIANTKAIIMLGEIQAVLQNDKLEYADMVHEIAQFFYENDITGAWWHD